MDGMVSYIISLYDNELTITKNELRKTKKTAKIIALLILTLLLSACATTLVTPTTPKTGYIKVPLHHQGDKECGPTSLAMVLDHYGVDLSRDQVKRDLYFDKRHGVSLSEMTNFSYWNYGLKANRITDANIGMIEEAITNKTPVLVAYLPTVSIGHWSVVVGYNRDKQVLIINDPSCGCRRGLRYEKFLSWWRNPVRGYRNYMIIISRDERK
jgi:ABC-type bacteriocin/lantibiotic exporter with double-glycine peptidase domain